jgi:hypothetical protein
MTINTKKIFHTLVLTTKNPTSVRFLMNAFQFVAPPHGGIAVGFDRICSVFNGKIPYALPSRFRKTMPDAIEIRRTRPYQRRTT